jgi:hypothetical protein
MPTSNSTIVHHGFHYDPETTVCYRTLDFLGFPGYRVGDDGSVWSLWIRKSLGYHKGIGRVIGTEWSILGSDRGHRGHMRVWLYPGCIKKLVHHLVLFAFVGPCLPGMECRHLDGNPANNALTNLIWGTRKENAKDREEHGHTARGEKGGNSKSTEDTIRAIRHDHATGKYSLSELSKKHGVSVSSAHRIVLRKTWKHVTCPSP